MSTRTVHVMDVPFLEMSEDEVVEHVLSYFRAGLGGRLVIANTEIVRQTEEEPTTRDLIVDAELVVPEDKPLIWASKLAGTPLKGCVGSPDILYALSEAAAFAGVPVFLLGATDDVRVTMERLEVRHPGILIDSYSPEPDMLEDQAEHRRICDAVFRNDPSIVFCSLGFPIRERLMSDLREKFPRSWFIGLSHRIDSPVTSSSFPTMRPRRTKFAASRRPRRSAIQNAPFTLKMMRSSLRRRYNDSGK